MKLSKCANSHYFDGDTYQTCPFCGASAVNGPVMPQGSADVTGAFESSAMASEPVTQKSEAVYEPVTQKSKAVYEPVNATVGLENMAPAAAPVAAAPVTPVAPAAPVAAPMDMSAVTPGQPLDATVGIPAPGGPLPEITVPAAPVLPEDNEKTVSFFQTQFGQTDTAREHTVNPSFTAKPIDPVVGWLVCTEGKYFGQSFQLKSGRNTISRSEGNDIVLAGDDTISRSVHAVIVYEPHERIFLVQPGNSRELFYVNDEVVLDSTKVNAFDDISLGSLNMKLVPFCTPAFAWDDLKPEKEEE